MSAARCRALKIGRSSPARGASPPTFRLRINCTCAWFAPHTPMAASLRSMPAAARAAPGVVAVWTAADVADIPPIDFRLTRIEGLDPYRQPILAGDRVRYVGEPVAVVFATDPYAAEDAADLVTVEIEALPELLGRRCAARRIRRRPFDRSRHRAQGLRRRGGGLCRGACRSSRSISRSAATAACRWRRAAPSRATTRRAILELARRRQGAALESRQPRAHARPRALLRASARRPYRRRLRRARRTLSGGRARLPRRAAARPPGEMDRRPARASDRRQSFAPAAFSRPRRGRRRTAGLLAIDGEFFHDQGAYVRTHAATVPDLAATMLLGPYRLAAYRMVGRIRLTNKTPCGTYRAPGRYESTFVRERLMDAIAARLRHRSGRNPPPQSIATAEMPYARHLDTLGTEMTYDSGDYAGLLDKALAAVGWHRLQQDLKRRRAAGEAVGAGLAMFVEKSGLGPYDGVRASIDTSGMVEIVTGATSVGQGMETVARADLRRCARRRLSARPRRARPDRPHRLWHGHIRLARDGDDRRSHAHCRGEAARQSARRRGRAVANAGRNARRDRRQGGAQECRAGTIDHRSATSRARSLPAQNSSATRRPGFPPKAGSSSSHMNYPYGDPYRGGARRPRYRRRSRSSAFSSPMTSAKRSIRCWSTARSPAASRKASAARCSRNSSTTRAASRSASTSPITSCRRAREIPPIEVLITEDAPSPLNSLGAQRRRRRRRQCRPAPPSPRRSTTRSAEPGAVTELPVTPQRLREICQARGRAERAIVICSSPPTPSPS